MIFQVGVIDPGGFRKIDQVKVTMLLHDLPLAEISYFEDFDGIAIRGSPVLPIGANEVLVGSFFRLTGQDVSTSKGGQRLGLTIRAQVAQDVPRGTVFRFTASDDSGATAAINRLINVPEHKGFSWGVLGLAVAVALFAGGFIGNVFSSRRRPPARPSIYATVQRRLEEERAAK